MAARLYSPPGCSTAARLLLLRARLWVSASMLTEPAPPHGPPVTQARWRQTVQSLSRPTAAPMESIIGRPPPVRHDDWPLQAAPTNRRGRFRHGVHGRATGAGATQGGAQDH